MTEFAEYRERLLEDAREVTQDPDWQPTPSWEQDIRRAFKHPRAKTP